ncbi:MAG: nickel pincer cofactor biosynthesis protein LarB [Deferribacteraceae bacterium]|jgi:NCAIR mutase (PurE)-related protein|nr:nickel pincer cofactor biosynthesis protein LarB [Deferribacteraceae bacterium]
MNKAKLILEKLLQGDITLDEAASLLSYEDLGYAKIDHNRTLRTGYAEVIFGEGKTPAQAAEIFKSLALAGKSVICTRADVALAKAVISMVPQAVYDETARLVMLKDSGIKPAGLVAVATGGTSDIPVAEEAALALEIFGSKVARIYDVGVAGLHRLLSNSDILGKANCVIAVAGMEGALPSVVSGLVSVPVIAVPTNIGYGANLGGITALLAMLCSCASGVSVVNINNGFGAACQADMINKLAVRGKTADV